MVVAILGASCAATARFGLSDRDADAALGTAVAPGTDNLTDALAERGAP